MAKCQVVNAEIGYRVQHNYNSVFIGKQQLSIIIDAYMLKLQ